MADEDDDDVAPQTPPKDVLMSLRFEQKMTREDIAEHFDVSIATVRRWIKELDIPRPERRSDTVRRAGRGSVQKVQAAVETGYSRFEIARIALNGRVFERTGRGYYLDGRPASADQIIAAADLIGQQK